LLTEGAVARQHHLPERNRRFSTLRSLGRAVVKMASATTFAFSFIMNKIGDTKAAVHAHFDAYTRFPVARCMEAVNIEPARHALCKRRALT
jgi:hypothetical protein